MINRIKNFFSSWIVAYYEISNWFYVRKIIRKHRKDADWQNYNLRADWICRIYTVINPQLPGDSGDPDEVLRIKYAERLKPVNLYLDNIGLGQSISPSYEKIDNSDSYLFVYSPIFNVITTWKVFIFMIFWVIFFVSKLDTWTWHGLVWIWQGITSLF
jgi:hypothetical protein